MAGETGKDPGFAAPVGVAVRADVRRRTTSRNAAQRRRPRAAAAAPSGGGARAVTVRFEPDGVSERAVVGECLSDVAVRAKVSLLLTCSVGDCGSCEIERVLESGERVIVRPCIYPVAEPEPAAGESVTYLTYPDDTY